MPLVKMPKKQPGTSTDSEPAMKEEAPMPSKEASVPTGSNAPEQIEVGGRTHSVHERRKLRASPKAGLADGIYPVVIEEDKNGKKVYKAVHGDHLYTIKNYGKGEDEVIIKLRESKGGRRTRSAESESSDPAVDFSIDDDVLDLLNSYKSLEHKLDPEAWLNNQLRKVLTEEVARLEKLRDGMKKIPSDLLNGLAGADPDKLEKIRALLQS